MHHPGRTPLLLGIDTGGTHTDAVLFSETTGLVAKAKALTTRYDLAKGIAAAVDAVLTQAGAEGNQIGLVSMSTTLATNALVEGQGGRAGLVMIGFTEADIAREGLRAALGQDPVLFLSGGHDVHGNERPLDLGPLVPWLDEVEAGLTGFAVCAYFAVRNPAHELEAMETIHARTGLPVTASHQLSARLGAPRRALTTLLNARLISLIDRLIEATSGFLEQRGITAPVMVVRGDGALISADLARARPIETILSGPAASLVGARQLTGLDDAIVSDIGGTTTDIALLADGRPRLDPEGATVGGWRTMVEAVAMRTFGLGGDSEVGLMDDALEPALSLGPRRLVPLALAEHNHPGLIVPELERQLNNSSPGRFDGRFAFQSGTPERLEKDLTRGEERVFCRLSREPQPLDKLFVSGAEAAMLQRLVSRGLVQVSGFTPTDAAHVAGLQESWDQQAARLGAALFARRRDGRGKPLAATPEEVSNRVLAQLTRCSAESVLETAFAEDGLAGTVSIQHPLLRRALDGAPGVSRLSIRLDRPIVGLGASARLHYANLGDYFSGDCAMPEHLDVANAIGAVAGQVRILVEAHVTTPAEGLFRASSGAQTRDFASEEEALVYAEEVAKALVKSKAAEAGAENAAVTVEREINTADVDGERLFIEANIRAIATGRPRIAVSN